MTFKGLRHWLAGWATRGSGDDEEGASAGPTPTVPLSLSLSLHLLSPALECAYAGLLLGFACRERATRACPASLASLARLCPQTRLLGRFCPLLTSSEAKQAQNGLTDPHQKR